uniref:Putative dehydrogenase n=1 Tax=Rhodnius prolixus TaxID=13249 RepID=R4FL85_RHOPR
MDKWTGRVAMVTGASSGIGEAITRELVEKGMKVAALARRTERLQNLEQELNKFGTIKGITCDITKPKEIKLAINWIESNWGDINVLVNNAGINGLEPLIGGTGELMSKIFETNVIGMSTCTREVTAHMMKRQVKLGHIININSTFGHFIPAAEGCGSYVASKHAITTLIKILKDELAIENSPVRVTSISPGFVETEMSKDYLKYNLPIISPKDVSNCVTIVLSTPLNVNITELTVQPTGELFNGRVRKDTGRAN